MLRRAEGCPGQQWYTPLIRAHRLADWWGLESLWLKNESLGLSGSFKDRGAVVAVREAISKGYKKILTASSGNAGAATAARAAMYGVHAIVLVDPQAPTEKLRQIKAYGAEIKMIEGLFNQPSEQFVRTLKSIAVEEDAYLAFYWEPVNSAIIQGFEVIAEEIVCQLRIAPEVVLIPTGGGDHFVAQGRAYLRLWRQGVIDHVPQLIAVQPEGACPLVDAVKAGLHYIPYRANPTSIASGLRVAFSGQHALSLIKDSEGTGMHKHMAVTVTEDQIRETLRLLATLEGLWIEPSGVAALAAIPDLLEMGAFGPDALIVAPLTGAGWKDHPQ